MSLSVDLSDFCRSPLLPSSFLARSQLLSGTAELFGTELMVDREYTFSPAMSSAASSSSSSSSASGGPAAAAGGSGSSAADDGSSTLRFAIFSWHGCELRIRGAPKTAYKKSDTPMISYINAHAALDNMRELTRNKQRPMGPRTMVIGAPDTGTPPAQAHMRAGNQSAELAEIEMLAD
jgi:hypothetical protein